MPKVMISYRNVPEQRQIATDINDMLDSNGIDTWIDHRSIPIFSRWEDAIVGAIKNSDFIVVCFSPEYFESEICLMECYIARGYGKYIIPIIVDPKGPEAVVKLISQHEETRGMESLTFGRLDANARMFGFPTSPENVFQRIIDVINHPISDENYNICVSYKAVQGAYATRIADDLNNNGLSTFISTLHLKLGEPWREGSWRAILQSKYHLIILTPDIKDSNFIKNEILVSRTKETVFLPILAEDFMNDDEAKAAILATFTTKEFALLNGVQWLIPYDGYDTMMQTLINYLKSG